MQKRIFFPLVSFLLGFVMLSLNGCVQSSAVRTSEVPDHPIQKGVSAPFAGFIGDWMVVGGGCNFPEIPAAEGGRKVYYKDIYACRHGEDSLQWVKVGDFPVEVAYGASVEMADGLICMGGMSGSSSLNSVYRLSLDAEGKDFRISELPALPETIDNAAGTKVGTTLYITGGNQGNGGNALYAFNLETDSVWKKLADYPGPKRIQPVLLGTEEGTLFLMGGFEVNADTKQAVISSDYLIYNIAADGWGESQAVPAMKDGSQRALVGCSGTNTGKELVVAGGVNYGIFKAAVEGRAPSDYMKRPSDWYQFSKDLLVYDLQEREWKVQSDVDGFNKAGGSLLYRNGNLYMVCGEIKPGIRTPEIVTYPLSASKKD